MIRMLATLIAAVALVTPRPTPMPSGGTSFTVGVWNVQTSSADMNFHSGDFSAPNKLHMTRDGGDVICRRAGKG